MIEIKHLDRRRGNVPLRVARGHFATNHSHINYYIDVTFQKTRLSEAKASAYQLVSHFINDTPVDTIVCLDGTAVLGACVAEELTKSGFCTINAHQTIYVVEPEFVSSSQMIFRDNLIPMVNGKKVLLLISTVKSGKTISRMLECMEYYGAVVQGIAAVFSTAPDLNGIPVYSLFTPDDIPGYINKPAKECPMCKAGEKITAIANSYGLSKL